MGTRIGRLSALTVKAAARGKTPGYYHDGLGLYLQVTPNGASWVFRFKVAGGKRREMGLGPLHTITLAEAREKAVACRKLRLEGIDPIEARRATRTAALIEAASAMTFRQCAEAYIAVHKSGWKNAKHRAQWPQTLGSFAYPVFGDLPVAAVDTALVMKAIEPIWLEKPETATRLRGRIESVIDWAKTRGYRQGENPARWKGHLQNLLPAKGKIHRTRHLAAMRFEEVGGFMAELRAQEGIAARALELLILTATRTGELRGAVWSEFDIAERLWTIPAERMKGDREHRVPLSDAAMAVIEQMRALRQSEHVFPGRDANRPLSETAMLMVLRRLGRDLTGHGFRSTFRDWCAERSGVPREIAELALSHAVGSAVEQAYMRTDLLQRRRQLMDAWARFCGQPPGGSVVPMRRAGGA